uniref:Electron transfer flavoprotein beta subunit lysine methyltransferase n=1 Tax=Sinocyclocheilus rhinocerous TaxID=307959 RepID=A0A673GM66_9TELE
MNVVISVARDLFQCWLQTIKRTCCLILFTPTCRFWTEKPDLWHFPDPYRAIYWPGGQALIRSVYLRYCVVLINDAVLSGLFSQKGAGSRLWLTCGASAIAAKLTGASRVVANDIDPSETYNMIGSKPDAWDLILLRDMFYDEDLADRLHKCLQTCITTHGAQVLIGDPGRAQFESHDIRRLLYKLAHFELPDSVKEENYRLTNSTVWCYNYKPDL